MKRYCTYNNQKLRDAISAVRQRRLKLRVAAKEFGVPKSTLYDHIRSNGDGQRICKPRLLTTTKEFALCESVKYMGKHGFPMTRHMVRVYVKEMLKRAGREMRASDGPSDKCFREFLNRHEELSPRTAENLDCARARMSSQATVDSCFELLDRVLDEHNLKNKESQIFNVDEVGFSGKEKSKTKVFGVRDGKSLYFSRWKESLPHRAFADKVPHTWLFGTSESGYMDDDLFLNWFKTVFLTSCGKERPVALIMDNHDSHITLPIVELARANDVVLIGLPTHTTHILQPLDVKINGQLKGRFSTIARNLGFASPGLTIGKANFPVVLRHALEQATPASIRDAFGVTGNLRAKLYR